MSTGSLCGLRPLIFGRKTSRFETVKKAYLTKSWKKESRGMKIDRSPGSTGNFFLMLELRKKIFSFRDIIDLPTCDGSATTNELVTSTMKYLHKLYPETVPKSQLSQIKGASIDKILVYFCEALRCIGDSWIANQQWMDKATQNLYNNNHKVMKSDQVVEIALATLNCIIRIAKDNLDMDEDVQSKSSARSSPCKISVQSYSDGNSSVCSSPAVTPKSVLPDFLAAPNSGDFPSYSRSPPILRCLRAQSIAKLNPIDLKRLSYHMVPKCGTQDRRMLMDDDEALEEFDAKSKSSQQNDNTDEELMFEIEDSGCRNETAGVPTTVISPSDKEAKEFANSSELSPNVARVMPDQYPTSIRTPAQSIPPRTPSSLPSNVEVPLPESPLKPPPPPPVPPRIPTVLRNDEESQPESSSTPLLPSPFLPPPTSSVLPNAEEPFPSQETKMKAPLPPSQQPPSTILEQTKLKGAVEPLSPAPPQSASPPPPPPPPFKTSTTSPPPQTSITPTTPQFPPPPPPLTTSKGSMPLPPPPPAMSSKGSSLPPPPPMPLGSGGTPPPPPPGAARLLRPKKDQSKLKRSSQLGNLYRTLKRKVEGVNENVKSSNGKKSSASSNAGGQQGMADALAEITKRSAYFQQIEEDVQKYAKPITELKTAISTFQTKDMTELIKFHKHVESVLENLTDETQVLGRFEGFPQKKLEALRTAAALSSKLNGMLTELQNWKIEPPVDKLLDKTERHFNKIKVEIDSLERTKDEESKKLQSHNIQLDFSILVRIKESIVDVSSNCMELALKEKRAAKAAETTVAKAKGKNGGAKMLWRAFQFAFRVYTFAGGHDDRADKLTRELAQEIEAEPQQA